MSTDRKESVLSTRERLVPALLVVAVIAGALTYLSMNTLKRTRNLTEFYSRIFYTRKSFFEPNIRPERMFDGDLKTAWVEQAPAPLLKGPVVPDPLPGSELFFIQMELGMTHYPDKPPIRNRILRLKIWPGDQSSQASFKENARPRTIRLIFFLQNLVDMDRDFQIPGLPRFWAERRFTLEDRPGYQEIELDFLDEVDESPRFPVNIAKIWMRMDIESLYEGGRNPRRTAISEIAFVERYPTLAPSGGCDSHPCPETH